MSKPIAMRMNAKQFESIKSVLEANGINKLEHDSSYNYSFINKGNDYDQANTDYFEDSDTIHEEFNAKVFLNSLGIDYEEPQPTEQVERYNIFDKAQQLIKDAKKQGVEIEIKEGVIILKQVVK